MTTLVVVAGPERSGKMPLARKLMSADPDLVLVHRDFLRASFEARVDEAHITLLMGDLARGIIRIGRSPIVVAWNLESSDRELWTGISEEFNVPLSWLDVRDPNVAALIPPLAA
jgi:ribose 1,5-bisphosphokinase PhnN